MYVFGQSFEERSSLGAMRARPGGASFFELDDDDRHSVVFRGPAGDEIAVLLRSRASLSAFFAQHPDGPVYLDITGLGHHIWAPLLRAAIRENRDVRVVYTEPASYARSATPTEADLFDLSERIDGIAPIPGFASLSRGDDADFVLVSLLGFEGARFSHVVENVEPPGNRLIPIVGVPGFRPEYPFHAYQGNGRTLVGTRAWSRVEYATANCPFSLFSKLKEIASRHDDLPMKVAILGTKPHAVGAVLYAIDQDASVELVYDHPVRKERRTRGSDRVSVYRVSGLVA
jgi:hypothetical protein